MRRLLISLLLFAIAAAAVVPGSVMSQTNRKAPANFAGRWRVKFTMGGLNKNLIFIAQPGNVGSFLLLDTGLDDKPVKGPQPAVWTVLSNDRVSFTGQAELPIGTCCREIGTLNFKGKFDSSNSISGRLLFVTSVTDDESPFQLRSVVGTFTATRLSK
ncbi:MAG: hypothetical protein ACRD9S_09975 [Pyrinomonadaceae bacterium]